MTNVSLLCRHQLKEEFQDQQQEEEEEQWQPAHISPPLIGSG